MIEVRYPSAKEGKDLLETMPPASGMSSDWCGARGTNHSCTRPAGHSGLHANHNAWGESSAPDKAVRAYWVRGE